MLFRLCIVPGARIGLNEGGFMEMSPPAAMRVRAVQVLRSKGWMNSDDLVYLNGGPNVDICYPLYLREPAQDQVRLSHVKQLGALQWPSEAAFMAYHLTRVYIERHQVIVDQEGNIDDGLGYLKRLLQQRRFQDVRCCLITDVFHAESHVRALQESGITPEVVYTEQVLGQDDDAFEWPAKVKAWYDSLGTCAGRNWPTISDEVVNAMALAADDQSESSRRLLQALTSNLWDFTSEPSKLRWIAR